MPIGNFDDARNKYKMANKQEREAAFNALFNTYNQMVDSPCKALIGNELLMMKIMDSQLD